MMIHSPAETSTAEQASQTSKVGKFPDGTSERHYQNQQCERNCPRSDVVVKHSSDCSIDPCDHHNILDVPEGGQSVAGFEEVIS